MKANTKPGVPRSATSPPTVGSVNLTSACHSDPDQGEGKESPHLSTDAGVAGLDIRALEERDRKAYETHPQQDDEWLPWVSEAVLPDEQFAVRCWYRERTLTCRIFIPSATPRIARNT
jgi:hypothetical protein